MNLHVGPWEIFGFLGNLTFGSRFFIQWIASEKAKKSVIPNCFWWLSIIGTVILLTYFIKIKNPVGILGYAPNVIPYTRNLILIYRHKKTDQAAQDKQSRAA